jgi:protein involved in polysaccharide export with SLBB domain
MFRAVQHFGWCALFCWGLLAGCAHTPPTNRPVATAGVRPAAPPAPTVVSTPSSPLPRTRLTPTVATGQDSGPVSTPATTPPPPAANRPPATPPAQPTRTAPLPAAARPEPAPDPQVLDGAYRLKPLDVIIVNLRGIPEPMEMEEHIDESGMINLPFIGWIKAADRTSSQLEREIERSYKEQQYYKQITVSILNPSQSYYVRGEVKQPGRFPLMSGVTVAQAVATAGGYTEFANPRKTQITRAGRKITIDLREVERRPDRDIDVKSGDVILVPRSIF